MNKIVSIIIVNYNGKHLLEECLKSIFELHFPKNKLEIIVVDNNSQDNSVSFIKKNYPNIILVEAKDNTGFTGGNNLGLEKASGDYVILLNNDTSVEKNWLNELIKASKDPKVGIVTSKLLYDKNFFELSIESDQIPRSKIDNGIDFTPVGLIIEDIVCHNRNISNLVWYKSGFYEKKEGDLITRWTEGKSKILLPYENKEVEAYTIKIHGYPSKNKLTTPIEIKAGNKKIYSGTISSNEVIQFKFEIKRNEIKDNFINLVQNAGNVIFKDVFSKDIGSVLRIREKERLEFYEEDNQYFDNDKLVLGACGAACLIKKNLINKIGFLDGHYFMYYEDVDFSLRAWRTGWNIKYASKAIVRHKHKASTGRTESEFFLHMVERNHLSTVITHFPISTIMIQLIQFLGQLLITLVKFNVFKFRDNMLRTNIWRTKAKARISTFIFLVRNLPRLIKNKLFWSKREKRNYQEMRRHLY